MGRNDNQTYVNVIVNKRVLGKSTETLAEFQIREPTAIWFNPAENEFAIEVSVEEFNDFGVESGSVIPLFHDGRLNLPRFQQQNTTTGDVLSKGSYADPTDDQTLFTVDQEIPDDRFRVRIYLEDPVANPLAEVLEDEEFTADPTGSVTLAERFVRLFDFDDSPVNTNANNQRTEIGGKLVDFDFGSSATPSLPAGVARFFVDIAETSEGNTGNFPSNGRYKIVTPSNRDFYQWRKYSKVLKLDN